MNKLDLAEALITIADTGSINEAANKLHQTSAAISKKLSKLESHLAIPLFYRERKGLILTPAGEQYYHEAKKAITQFILAEQSVVQELKQPHGDLKIIAKQYYMQTIILPKLSEFLTRYPYLNVQLDATEIMPNFDVKKMDIIFGCAGEPASKSSDNLIQKQIDVSRFILCASPTYLKRKGIPKSSTELLQHDFIAHGYRKIPEMIILDKNEQIITKPKLTLNNTELMIAAALAHLGFIYIDEKIVLDLISKKKLVQMLPQFTKQLISVYIFYASQYKHDPKIRAFMNFFSELCATKTK